MKNLSMLKTNPARTVPRLLTPSSQGFRTATAAETEAKWGSGGSVVHVAETAEHWRPTLPVKRSRGGTSWRGTSETRLSPCSFPRATSRIQAPRTVAVKSIVSQIPAFGIGVGTDSRGWGCSGHFALGSSHPVIVIVAVA